METLMKKNWLLFLFFIMIVTSCEDNITTSCEDEETEALQATLSTIQTRVFNAYCVDCHSGSSANGNLDLSAGNAYANLVDVPSGSTGKIRVDPGNSAGSYLLDRIKGIGGETIMPPAGSLDQELIDLVENWIDEGAKND